MLYSLHVFPLPVDVLGDATPRVNKRMTYILDASARADNMRSPTWIYAAHPDSQAPRPDSSTGGSARRLTITALKRNRSVCVLPTESLEPGHVQTPIL